MDNQKIVKPNWNIFRAKFNGAETSNFEYFCYLLFCIEFKKTYGIFRYKNQAGIETEPIEIDGKVIGFQSKFYDVKLADKKTELLKMLDTIHKKYPSLTELKLYTNKDWGQGKKENESQVKVEIETKAKELNIAIHWRTDEAYFQSLEVSVINKDIASHFFSMESVYDLINEKQNHTQRVLNNINTEIKFDTKTLELDRTSVLNDLKEKLENYQVLILSGVGGVGKTAVIKKLYEYYEDTTPFYLFKANEFNLHDINDIFGKYSLENFIEIHKVYKQKIAIIDSSEKLLDIDNLDVFREFLHSLIENSWNIIFTTRNNYLDDLNYQFIELLNIQPFNINIENISNEGLIELSEKYKFNLPNDINLEEFIRNPFYLNEYLTSYQKNEHVGYQDFKQKIWKKNIKSPNSEQCFLNLSFQRANLGEFFINIDCSQNSLKELRDDGILGYESSGYFISHDIYEEWALERIINREFINRSNNNVFFQNIGNSLPIRRAFRSWVSDNLLLDDENIKLFIDEIIDSEDIAFFWKDEVFISILLSDYSDIFFENFDRELKENNFELLKRLSFLLRLACKEVDNNLIKQYKLSATQKLKMFQLFNMPKGKGWKSFILFIFDNIETLKLQNINMILPVLYDWNNKFFDGETTRKSSLIALKYYSWINENRYYGEKDQINKICKIIINGSNEIKSELKFIFDKIIDNKWKNHRDNYNELSKIILSGFDGYLISKNIPEYVLKLADLFWTKTHKEIDNTGMFPHYERKEVEGAFRIEGKYEFKYFPSSAYQTPILFLLRNHFKITLDFILEFVNKSVVHYAKSGWEDQEDIKTVNVYIDDNTTVQQYHSSALWSIYRGTSSPVSPNLMQSIHMALEKHLLEIAKYLKVDALETWLKYMLMKSQSSSISAVVGSIVLANQDKIFNVATMLFQTKEFIQADLVRHIEDKSVNSLYGMGYSLNYIHKIYQDERLKTCEDKHRDNHLENLFLNYQLFRTQEVTEEESNDRQQKIWKILDDYYAKLPIEKEQLEIDKTWRMFLARIDKRKMDIETEKVEDGIQITFNSELSSELKKYSEKAQQESSNTIKYTSLYLWSRNKVEDNEDYKKYIEYENNPLLSLEQIKEVSKISRENRDFIFQDEIFSNVSIVLLRDYNDELTQEDKEFCKDIILEFATLPLNHNYYFQMSDGVESAIKFLPILLKDFSELKDDIEVVLLLHLFNDYPIGMSGVHFYDYAIYSIYNYFDNEKQRSLFLGYLLLKSKFSNRDIEKFIDANEQDIKKIFNNEICLDDINRLEELDLDILNTSLKILVKNKEIVDFNFLKQVTRKFILDIFKPLEKEQIKMENLSEEELLEELFGPKRKEYQNIDSEVKDIFFISLSNILLHLEKNQIEEILQPLIENFNLYEDIANLITQIILEQDKLKKYENFWYIWNLFESSVISACKDVGNYNYTKQVIQSYLLAFSPYGELWKDTAKDWHTLENKDKRFFKRMSESIGHCPSTLYSLSKLMISIGSKYLNDGIVWISNMLRENHNLYNDKLETNTIYNIEILIRKYIFENTKQIKREKKIKEDVLLILNFLIEKGSSLGYMLRERIL